MTLEEIKRFRQLHSKTAGHPEYGYAKGIETTTGPLGQGIANAVGMAIAERSLAARFGSDLVDHRTWVIAGDGCLMEGISHEAAALAGRQKLNKLIVIWDDNNISIDGEIKLSDITDQKARFAAYGWTVLSCDGHDAADVTRAYEAALKSDKPVFIACKTTIGFGAPKKAGTHKAHGEALGAEELKATKAALGIKDEPFFVAEDVRAQWRAIGARGGKTRAAWEKRLSASNMKGEFEAALSGDAPAAALKALAAHTAKMAETKPALATRAASGGAIEAVFADYPELLGGSADLTPSNNTQPKAAAVDCAPETPAGRYIRYGVREHAMAAAMNGIALHGGFVPYGGTFLSFADYSRPSIRLAALMGIRVIHVMTHDSIGLGEDGPTHQPVEQIAALRAIPNLYVFRPADAVETAEAWDLALKMKKAPSLLALSRQATPGLRGDAGENKTARGAYELLAAEGGAAKVSLFATGTEVALAVAARDALQSKGVPTRVVSCPCFELFAAQDEAYRAATIGKAAVRVGVEAAVRQSWDLFLRAEDGFIGVPTFGVSAPAKDAYKHFGVTAEAVAEAAFSRLK